jgi:hypothetical protein
MNIKINIEKDFVEVGDQKIGLDRLRDFILSHWSSLAVQYRIRPISSKGNVLFTYDWNRIFSIVVDGAVVIEEFLKVNGLLKTITFRQENLF